MVLLSTFPSTMALCQLKLCGRVKAHVLAINKFTSPFDVDVESTPSEVQMKLVDLQCSDELKSRFAAVGHADFWRKHILLRGLWLHSAPLIAMSSCSPG